MRMHLRLKGLGCLATLPEKAMAAPYLCVGCVKTSSLYLSEACCIQTCWITLHLNIGIVYEAVVCCGFMVSLVIPKSFWAHTFACKNIRKLIYGAGALANFFVILLSFERTNTVTDGWAFVSKRQSGRSRKSSNKNRHMFVSIMHFETPRACHF